MSETIHYTLDPNKLLYNDSNIGGSDMKWVSKHIITSLLESTAFYIIVEYNKYQEQKIEPADKLGLLSSERLQCHEHSL
jgi:hypothetical protein